jgi:large repetitive protein
MIKFNLSFNLRSIFVSAFLLLNLACGEIVSNLEYSLVKGANLSWASKVNISSINISAYPVSGQCVPQYNDVTVSVGDPVLIQQDFTCVNCLFNGVMDLSSAGLAEGPIAVNATQISLTVGALVQVLVDTIIPIAPTIVTPVDGSSTTTITQSVTGACETGATVNVFGDFTGSPLTAPCVSSSYVRSISLILGNGVKSISATQTDSVGNTSPATAITINLGIPPSAPTITSPTAGLLTNQTAQTITGTCETGATVNISGDVVGAPVTSACVASAYSQSITLTASNGVKSIDVSQTNTAGTSPTVNRTVNLDTVNPAAPGISTPVNGAQTNVVAQTVAGTLSGSCEAGATVNISGDIVGSPVTTSCVSTTYSRAVTLVIGDGVKNISATQTDAAGNTSVATNISITLDQTLPIAPTIASPANGLITNTQNQTISGTCETAATVSISGGIIGAPVTTVCAAGSYSTAITLTAADGVKALNVTQRDVATNLSPAASISVTLDRTLPSAPTITSPVNSSYTNQTAQTVSGACESGATVNLSGDFTGSPLTTVCAASAYSRAITLTAGDGAKSISATQTDVAGNTSTPTNISITLDTVNPAAPVITTPANNSFTNATSVIASGTCISGTPVNLFGDFTGSPVTTPCGGGGFSRSVTLVAPDGVKTINANQADLAGNLSATATNTVTLDRVAPTSPTITSPVNGTTVTNSAQTVTGACETNATVQISGNIIGSPVSVVCAASAYSQAVTLTASYGAKAISVIQTDQAGNSSAPPVSVSVNYTNLNVTYPASFTNLKYTPLNTPAAGIAPTVVSGTPTSYSISPALPTGLSFNTTSGLISGTPTASDDVGTTYTITINDAIGTIQRTMFLRIAIPDYTWMGNAGDGLWNTAANWRINAVPPTTAYTYFDDECLVSGNCNVNVNVNSQVRRVYMKPTYTGTITQNPGITFQVGYRSSPGSANTAWGKWVMDAGTFVGGNSNLIVDRLNIQGGTFTSTSATLQLGSAHTFRGCDQGSPSWDWVLNKDCGFTL